MRTLEQPIRLYDYWLKHQEWTYDAIGAVFHISGVSAAILIKEQRNKAQPGNLTYHIKSQGINSDSPLNIRTETSPTSTPTDNIKHPFRFWRCYGTKAESLPKVPESVKKQIRERDHYTCQLCGEYGKDVDHIVPHDITHDNSPENLRVLCRRCNTRRAIDRRFRERQSLSFS